MNTSKIINTASLYDFFLLNIKKVLVVMKKNAFKLCVIFFALHILIEKEVTFSVNMNSSDDNLARKVTEEVVPVHQSEVKDESGENFALLIDNIEMMDSEQANPSIPHRGNTFSNLGFILNPFFTKKKKSKKNELELRSAICNSYVERFAKLAQNEMKKYDIPASIILAQGLLESNAGEHPLAQKHNNHFGIKCKSRKCSKGHCSNIEGDSHKDFYKNYDSAWESFRDHSKFLQKDRYAHLKKLETKDYYAWAVGLKLAGYSDDENYVKKLIQIIESLELDRYDE